MELFNILISQQWFWALIIPLLSGGVAWFFNRRKKTLDFEDQVRDGRLKEIEYFRKSLENARLEIDVLERSVVKWKSKYYNAFDLIGKTKVVFSLLEDNERVIKSAKGLIDEIELFISLEEQQTRLVEEKREQKTN